MLSINDTSSTFFVVLDTMITFPEKNRKHFKLKSLLKMKIPRKIRILIVALHAQTLIGWIFFYGNDNCVSVE